MLRQYSANTQYDRTAVPLTCVLMLYIRMYSLFVPPHTAYEYVEYAGNEETEN
jgi:hypothetical protein